MQKLDANAKFVEERRRKVDFAPGNREGVEAFLKEVRLEDMPLGAFVLGARKVREEREKVLEEVKERERREREERKGARGSGDGGDGGEREDVDMAEEDEDEAAEELGGYGPEDASASEMEE